ncbi:DNA topoisomerase III [Catenovulum sp. SM1970]|uniref:DNA topoisomerase 3 n=1 Tax=Marinifaba aquimaris TaxID=2741323 RepID=UPI00157282F1|nr:DNA topoisomerase III [Marinifaba aquimaris]
MKLYIAEKPSLGRAIAQVLPKPHKNEQGYIQLANGDCVTWCVGHLLEQAAPDDYDDKYKKWQFDHLPIVPESWQLKAKAKTRSQLSVIKKLVKKASEIINAGDPDREGQILVDEVINHAKPSSNKIQNAKRLLINDLNPQAVKKALANLKPNKEFIPLATSALARARADWLYGMNMTRAYTLQGQKAGYKGVLSVGRVQTPLLGLVVERDNTIKDFISKPFYQVLADLITQNNERFKAKWVPSAACQDHLDEEGRLLNKALAENIVNRISGKAAKVEKVERELKKQNAPLPFNLSQLQMTANKAFGINAKACLDTCQALYEKHKLITYPRSDCQYLPLDHFYQANDVVSSIASTNTALNQACQDADTRIKSKAWNNAKVDAHHAIIPTTKKADISKLSQYEAKVYNLIAKQYLAQFYPAHEFEDIKVKVRIETGQFSASSKQTKVLGWKSILGKPEQQSAHTLPPLEEGQDLTCVQGILEEKQTEPPKHFTDASLLSAMTGIARYVKDKAIKQILKDTDGLGTEATRAGMIELLIKRGFITRQNKNILATAAGTQLIASLPSQATTPDMTALWEANLDQISHKTMSYQHFMAPMLENLQALLITAEQTQMPNMAHLTSPAKTPFKKRKSTASKGKFNTKTASKTKKR